MRAADAALVRNMIAACDAHDHNKPKQPTNITFNGFPLTIEYPAHSRRTLRDKSGKVVYDRWLDHAYGFFRGVMGSDGDELDAIVGPKEKAAKVYVVFMLDLGPDIKARENEDKVLIGFPTYESALKAFERMYGHAWIGGVSEFSVPDFRLKLRTGDSLHN